MFPLVFCTGMLRSGSTWSFNVCRLIAEEAAARTGQRVHSGFLAGEQTDAFIARFPSPPPGPTIIKAHAMGPRTRQLLQQGSVRIVCTYRDPRDCVASMTAFTGLSFDAAAKQIYDGLKWLDFYGRCPQTLFIRYEQMMRDRLGQLRRIAAHLEMSLDEPALARIDAGTAIEQSRQICEELKDRPGEEVIDWMDHRVDPRTWLHDNHVQSAKGGRWKDELSTEQLDLLDSAYAPWLQRLDYDA